MPNFTILCVSNSPLSLEMAKMWPFHGQNMVLQIGSSWILINVPRDVPCWISHCWVYSVAPFPKNGQNTALLWPKHGPHMVLQIGASWILINVSSREYHFWHFLEIEFTLDDFLLFRVQLNRIYYFSGNFMLFNPTARIYVFVIIAC